MSRGFRALVKTFDQPSQTMPETVVERSVLRSKFTGLVIAITVFFFARSPDAPNTTITVLSLSSMVLGLSSPVNHVFFFFKLSSLIAATKKQEKASALSLAEDGKELPLMTLEK